MIKNIVYIRDLLIEMVKRDIKLRYKGSILGILWSLLNPLSQLIVFIFIFGHILPLNIPNYPVFVFTALLAWTWFQSSLFSASTAIVDGRSLIKRPGFPVGILPIITVTSNLIHYLLALPVLIIFLILTKAPISTALLFLPLVIGLQFLFTLGLAYIVATFHVSFRDTQHLVGVLLLLLFYLTPIFYNASLVPDRFQTIYQLNPVLQLVEAYRAILLEGAAPAWQPFAILGAFSTLLLYGGYALFVRASYQFVEEL